MFLMRNSFSLSTRCRKQKCVLFLELRHPGLGVTSLHDLRARCHLRVLWKSEEMLRV
jgi:hypothetical protein